MMREQSARRDSNVACSGTERQDRKEAGELRSARVRLHLKQKREFPTMPLEHIPNSGLFGNAQGNVCAGHDRRLAG